MLEATSNYHHIHDALSEHLDVTVAHPKKINKIADTDKKTDRVDAKELARMFRLNSVPESYVPTEQVREARALVRGRQTPVENRTKYANKVHGLLSDHGITEDVKPLNKVEVTIVLGLRGSSPHRGIRMMATIPITAIQQSKTNRCCISGRSEV